MPDSPEARIDNLLAQAATAVDFPTTPDLAAVWLSNPTASETDSPSPDAAGEEDATAGG